MTEKTTVHRSILRFTDGTIEPAEDLVATEFPLTVFINQEEFATLVCSPNDLEELVIGFLASEGVIQSYSDVKDLIVDEKAGLAYVETRQLHKINQQLYSKRYITSCCGKSRQSFYFYNDAKTAKSITSRTVWLSPEDCFHLMDSMQQEAVTFHATGGVHNASICDRHSVLVSRMDIGRHNALDKLYGHCLMHQISLEGKIVVFSGRISSEVLLKVAKIGCEVVLSKSAPTELALQMADELGITAVGFIRNHALNIYTHPERITSDQS